MGCFARIAFWRLLTDAVKIHSTTTLIIVCTIIGVVLGLAIFLLMRWKARRAHERGLVEIEQARRRGEDVESQLKSRAAVGIAIGPEKSLLQRTKSGGFKDEEVLTTVRLDGDESAPMRSPPLVEPPGASITVQRSLSKHALARSMSQYGSNSELNKALDMVPLHQQRQERRATMTNWASSKRLPESTILVIKDPRPPTPTNLSSSDLVEPSLRRSDSGTHPPHPNRAQTASPTRPSALPQKLVQQLPPVTLASTAASAAHTAVPKPQQPRATGLAAPVSLAQTHAAGSAAERSTSPTPTPAPTTPSVSPPHPTNSANPLSLPVSAGSMRRPAGRPKTGNEYVTTHVSMSIKKDGGAQ